MRVGIHEEPLGQFSTFLQRYERILAHNGLDHVRVNANQTDFLERVRELDLFIYRWGHYDIERNRGLAIIPAVEWGLKVPCFPNVATCWHYDDKVRQHYLLSSCGYPVIESYVFWEKEPAMTWAETTELPVVFKLKGGASSNNVALVRTRYELRNLIERAFREGFKSGELPNRGSLANSPMARARHKAYVVRNKLQGRELPFTVTFPDWVRHRHYVYFQKYLPDNRFDTRVTVIGDRAFAFRRYNRPDDFRASGSGRIDHRPEGVDLECVKLAHRISQEMNFQSMAYDFLYGPDGQVMFCEVSYTYQDVAVFRCPGYWDRDLQWHDGHYWPQYSQLVHLLSIPDLEQPGDLLERPGLDAGGR